MPRGAFLQTNAWILETWQLNQGPLKWKLLPSFPIENWKDRSEVLLYVLIQGVKLVREERFFSLLSVLGPCRVKKCGHLLWGWPLHRRSLVKWYQQQVDAQEPSTGPASWMETWEVLEHHGRGKITQSTGEYGESRLLWCTSEPLTPRRDLGEFPVENLVGPSQGMGISYLPAIWLYLVTGLEDTSYTVMNLSSHRFFWSCVYNLQAKHRVYWMHCRSSVNAWWWLDALAAAQACLHRQAGLGFLSYSAQNVWSCPRVLLFSSCSLPPVQPLKIWRDIISFP